MWLPQSVISDVNRHARVFYIDSEMTWRWNEHRRKGEPRLMCGWCWESKHGPESQTGINSKTQAYLFAHLALVAGMTAPRYRRLRVVARAA